MSDTEEKVEEKPEQQKEKKVLGKTRRWRQHFIHNSVGKNGVVSDTRSWRLLAPGICMSALSEVSKPVLRQKTPCETNAWLRDRIG